MADWTLTHNSVTKTLAAWGMQNATISEKSLTAGVFTAQMPGDMLAELAWEYEDQITLKLGSVVKFIGIALPPQRRGAVSTEMITVRFVDPWWWMSQATYTQPWWIHASSAAFNTPHVALFANITPGTGWVLRSIGDTIADIVSQCNTYFGGNVMQLGTLSGDGFDAKPIPQRLLNVTYESALRQTLAWVPDAIQQWDYTTTPPTLHFVQRAEATARSYAFCDGQLMMQQQITRRDDLVVEGIKITYAGLDAFGFVNQIHDQAGATTGTRLVKTVIDCTGNAHGGSAITPTYTPELTRDYRVEVDTVSHGSAEWWLQYGDTGATDASQITVNKHAIKLAENAPENAGKTGLDGCNLLWVGGGIPKSELSNHRRIADVRATLVITTTTTEEGDVGDGVISTVNKEVRICRLLLPVTDLAGTHTQRVAAGTTSYSGSIVGALSAAFVVNGIAEALLAAWSVAPYEGSIVLTAAECNEAVRLGDVINLTGGETEWETMNTPVHGMTRDLDTGTTTLELGVAPHLGLDEYVSLIKMSRTRMVPALDLDHQAKGEVTPEPPAANDLDDLVGPGSIIKSMLILERICEIARANASYKIDLTDAGEEE